MKRSSAITLAFASSLLLAGCGHAAVERATATPTSAAPVAAPVDLDVAVYEQTPEIHAVVARSVGDFVVFRYSGSFRKASLTLTERVVSVEPNALVVDFTLAEGKKEDSLRVRFDQTPGGKGGVVSVARLEKGIEKPASKGDFESLMAKTVLAADANEENLGTEIVHVAVSGKNLAAKKTSYRVVVGEKSATMSVTQSDDFLWGDVAGEIKADDGSLLYRAELLEAGSGEPVATK